MDRKYLDGPYISQVAWEYVKFYQNPENIKAFHEWLAKKKKKEGEDHGN